MANSKKYVLILLLSYFAASFVSLSRAAEPMKNPHSREAYKFYRDIPAFISFVANEDMETYTQRVLEKVTTFLEHTDQPIQYIDENRSVTQKNLEKYISLAGERIVSEQKIKFSELDTNKNEIFTFQELSEKTKIKKENLEDIYEIFSEHKEWAGDKIDLSLRKIKKDGVKAPETWLISQWIVPWLRLDKNKDHVISKAEINTPDEIELKRRTEDTVEVFEQYLSLDKDRRSVTFDAISEAALKSFKKLDADQDKVISALEYNRYVQNYLVYKNWAEYIIQTREQCSLPSLKSEVGPTYVVYTAGSDAISSAVYYSSDKYQNNATYTEVHIEKQAVPINLVLNAGGPRIWSFSGDTQSISHLLILGDYDYSEIDESKQYLSGVVGVPKDKVIFSGEYLCLGQIKTIIPSEPLPVKEERRKQIEKNLEMVLDVKPYLVKTEVKATHILIKSSPEIEIDKAGLSGTKNLPKGFKKEYWSKFLKKYPQGYKKIDRSKLISGGYSVEEKIYPGWAGLAQLEQQGVIRELKVDEKNNRAVFLLKKDLPRAPAYPPLYISLILENENLAALEDDNPTNISYFCVTTKDGNYVRGHSQACNASDISLLKTEKPEPSAGSTVFLKLRKYLPVYPSYKDTIDIKFEIDEPRCRKEYKEFYKEKCKIPKDLSSKKIPGNAVSVSPEMFGKAYWKNEETITYEPPKPWSEQSDFFELSVDLDALSAPSNILINGKRKANAEFTTSYQFFELTNVKIVPEESDETKKRMSANIQTNYPIREFFNFTIFNIPDRALMPDENSQDIARYTVLNYEEPWDDVSFEMTEDTKGRISVVLVPDKNNLSPTHLYFSVISTQPYVKNYRNGYWFDLREEKNPKYSKDINDTIDKAKEGDPSAQLALGKMYDEAKLLPKSLSMARFWLKKAAEKGSPDAALAYGKFALSRYPAKATENEENEAYYWLMKASENNDPEAQYLLGVLQSQENGGFVDYPESIVWLKKAAGQNYLPAVLFLAKEYEQGLGGLKINTAKALDLYSKAAAMGSLEADALIARMHYFGWGVKEDTALGYKLAKKVLSMAKREDIAVRDIAARLIADTLIIKSGIDQTTNEAEIFKKCEDVADIIFKEFSTPLERLWIIHQLPSMRYSMTQTEKTKDIEIARKVLHRQESESPRLEEIKLIKAKLLLQEGYLYQEESFSRFKRPYIEKAISFLEEIKKDPFLEKEVFTLLMECYLSINDTDAALNLLNYAMFERYFTSVEIARGAARYAEYTGNAISAVFYYEMINDQEGIAQATFQSSGTTDKYEKSLKMGIKKNPKNARAYEKYGWFLLMKLGNYEKAIKMAGQSLKLYNTNTARQLAGLAFIVKASQLNKTEGFSENVENNIKAAHMLGLTRWTVAGGCSIFCQDIKVLYDEYYRRLLEKHEREGTNTDTGEIENIKARSRDKSDPI